VLLAGGGLGNAVLFSIGRAMREAGNRLLYFAGYKTIADRYKVADIEAAADVIVWACDEAPGFDPSRPQDLSFTGTIVDAIAAYGDGVLGEVPIPLGEVDRIVTIGSECMMKEICAQCLQAHRDPETGLETVVFSCFNQDQPLDSVDFDGLAARLRQNSVQEKLTAQWIDHCQQALEKRG
jgi:NAD(P)H-flavin reductase